MWAIGAGISTASAGPSPWTRAISEAFQLRPRWVWSTALGIPVEPEVNRTKATSDGAAAERRPTGTGAPPTASASAAGSEKAVGSDLEHEGGIDLAEGRLDVRRAERVQDGRRHGADAPAGPGQDGGGQAVRDLPRHGLARAGPRARGARRPPVATSASACGGRERAWRRPPPRRRGQ